MAGKVSRKLFYSKILLFGEHIINKGAMGLALPLNNYSGCLSFGDTKNRTVNSSNTSIENLANHIVYSETLASNYNTNLLLEDIERGLYFDSDIPQGYGLGSSGALVAAIYFQYYKFRKRNYVLSELKNELAQLESYFHGKSSGLDALVCYLNKTVLLNNGEVAEAFNLPKTENGALKVFVVNTHIERNTSPFVNLFLVKYENKKFADTIQKSIVPANNTAINSFLQKKYTDLWRSLKIISQLQYDLLPEFIPKNFAKVWETGLQTGEYHLKICGAGGGGFIIGFAKADANLETLLRGLDVITLMEI